MSTTTWQFQPDPWLIGPAYDENDDPQTVALIQACMAPLPLEATADMPAGSVEQVDDKPSCCPDAYTAARRLCACHGLGAA